MDISAFHTDVILSIIRYLTAKDLGSLLQCEKRLYTFLNSQERFWKCVYYNFYEVIPSKVTTSWNEFFKLRQKPWYPSVSLLFGDLDHNGHIQHSFDNNDLLLVCKSAGSWNNSAGTWSPVSHVFNPIPIHIDGPKVLYWEISVEDELKGQGNAMGLMIKNANLNNHMPGWVRGTYAMHSDDGHAYYNNDNSIYNCKSFAYGPAYQNNGVVIGCGYNFNTREVFFTHNGLLIGIAFVIPSQLQVGEICPCIGMMTQKSIYRINVGQKPFMFNIDAYICGENIEKLSGLVFDESDAHVNEYRVTRKETIEKMQNEGKNFLQVFDPKAESDISNMHVEEEEDDAEDEEDEEEEEEEEYIENIEDIDDGNEAQNTKE